MSWFNTALATAKLGLKGLNWQAFLIKWGIVAAVVVGAYAYGRDEGKDSCELKQAEDAAEVAQQKTIIISEIVVERIPVVAKAEKDSAALKQELKTVKEKLDEANRKNTGKPECSLSPDELRLYREAANKTKR